jgi:hypothetical protein
VQPAPSTAARFLAADPRLREHLDRSPRFAAVAEAARLGVAGRDHYIVRGDTLGGIEDLYLETLVSGASGHGSEAARAVFEELDEDLKELVRRRVVRRR